MGRKIRFGDFRNLVRVIIRKKVAWQWRLPGF